jgi:hypothetical protein
MVGRLASSRSARRSRNSRARARVTPEKAKPTITIEMTQ